MTDASPEIVCLLSAAELRERKALYRRKLTPFMTQVATAGGQTTLEFSKPEVTATMLEEFIELENACCPFLTFEMTETDRSMRLLVSGPEGSEDLVRDVFVLDTNKGACCSG
ncbi:MAG: hypothetical protein AAF965_13490 [Pseudomonadota bacterium]